MLSAVYEHNLSFKIIFYRHYERYEVSKTIEEQPSQSVADRYL